MLRTRGVNVLCVCFLLALSGLQGGAISVVYYGQRYLDWGPSQLGYYVAGFSLSGGAMIVVVHPLVSALLGRRLTDLAMVRAVYLGPAAYFLLLALLPNKGTLAFALLPLFGLGPCALPHFRALFAASRPDEALGETLALVAALESLPQLIASPLASLAFAAFLHTPSVVLVGCAALPLVATLGLWALFRTPARAIVDVDAPPLLAAAINVHNAAAGERAADVPAGSEPSA